jgi:hypothetical protein
MTSQATAEQIPSGAESMTADPLARIELRIAQRADTLARSRETQGTLDCDRATWRRAEAEVFGHLAAAFFEVAGMGSVPDETR